MLTGRKRKAIAALLVEPTKAAAANAAGISERTLRDYFKDDEFRAEYRKAADTLLDEATLRLKQLLPSGMDALHHLLSGKKVSDANRNTALRTLLEYTAKYNEQNDIVQRLEELERRQNDDCRV